MSSATLLDLAKLNGRDRESRLIEAVTGVAPEVDVLPARTIKGTSYDTALRTALPTVQFRSLNAGVTASKSRFETRKVQCHLLSARIVVDKALAQAFEDGVEAFQDMEATGAVESAKIELGQQIFYGRTVDSLGFPGLSEIVPAAMVVDATGTTAGTGSSVYAVRGGPLGVQLVFGQGQGLVLDKWIEGDGVDAEGKKFPAYIGNLTAWAGLQCVNPYAVARIKNLTADTGKGVTDARIQEMLDLFPAGRRPDFIFMSRRSASQLQRSRSVVIVAGPTNRVSGSVEALADWPTEAFGIPIIVTDSLVNTEALV